jgi:hypothetical protein
MLPIEAFLSFEIQFTDKGTNAAPHSKFGFLTQAGPPLHHFLPFEIYYFGIGYAKICLPKIYPLKRGDIFNF